MDHLVTFGPLGTHPAYCWAYDRIHTNVVIMLCTWCYFVYCDECVPDWWFAI